LRKPEKEYERTTLVFTTRHVSLKKLKKQNKKEGLCKKMNRGNQGNQDVQPVEGEGEGF